MSPVTTWLRHAFLPITAALSGALISGAFASTILHGEGLAEPNVSSAALEAILDSRSFQLAGPGSSGNQALIRAVGRGQWSAACAMAADILAEEQPDLDAVGVLAICAALRNDRATVETLLEPLRSVQPPHDRYGPLAQGILSMMDKAPDKALDTFGRMRARDASHPLASYFAGEALHALGRNSEAIDSFNACLEVWPEHAPAFAAIAVLMSGSDDSPETLTQAIALTEQATHIEPTNRAYWRQLADLCERNGEFGRASAIRLQWLTPRIPR